MEDKLKDLLEYVKADGRICPKPPVWQALWEMFPDNKIVGSGWETLHH
jgi:O-antigen ligase